MALFNQSHTTSMGCDSGTQEVLTGINVLEVLVQTYLLAVIKVLDSTSRTQSSGPPGTKVLVESKVLWSGSIR
jgi:hypothetical protein